MPNELTGTAELVSSIKSVYANIYLGDADFLHPELVTKGVAILRKGTLELSRTEFDAQHGNSDGAFYLTFHHIVVTDPSGLTLHVDINESEYVVDIVPTTSNRDVFVNTLPPVEQIDTRLEL